MGFASVAGREPMRLLGEGVRVPRSLEEPTAAASSDPAKRELCGCALVRRVGRRTPPRGGPRLGGQTLRYLEPAGFACLPIRIADNAAPDPSDRVNGAGPATAEWDRLQ